MTKKPSPVGLPPTEVTVTNCQFIAVGRHRWNPAVRIDGNRVRLGESVIAPRDFLRWRSFTQYKLRNVPGMLKRFIGGKGY